MSSYQETPVRDIMHREVQTIAPSAPLETAAKTMLELDITCLIVDLQDPTRGLGIITQKDIVSHLFDGYLEGGGMTVEDIMSQPTIALDPDWSLKT
ncbi:MAG: CBS domain-containing protein, partial [Planctomycetes bacterium]|nr:CBS domain-containing protein [Planctomycetota bacterium]